MNRHTGDVDIGWRGGGTGSISCVICMFDGGLSTTEDRWSLSIIFFLEIDDSLKVTGVVTLSKEKVFQRSILYIHINYMVCDSLKLARQSLYYYNSPKLFDTLLVDELKNYNLLIFPITQFFCCFGNGYTP